MPSINHTRLLQPEILQQIEGFTHFANRLKDLNLYPLTSSANIDTLQINIGKICNLTCRHCHVEAGPHRTESMPKDIMAHCLKILAESHIPNLDITGGAPELNPHLAWLIEEAGHLGCHVMLRTNLTLLGNQEYAHLPEYFAQHQVELVSSLPCYTEENTDGQRGAGVFNASIKVLLMLNDIGYGKPGGSLKLNLVYNPGGAFLPADQKQLEEEYRQELQNRYGITYSNLFTMTNVPVGRFLTNLNNSGMLPAYLDYLAQNFNPATLSQLMCRRQISVGWDGALYDCDFNQMLGITCVADSIKTVNLETLLEREIRLGNHCYACTAGSGSGCGGTIANIKLF